MSATPIGRGLMIFEGPSLKGPPSGVSDPFVLNAQIQQFKFGVWLDAQSIAVGGTVTLKASTDGGNTFNAVPEAPLPFTSPNVLGIIITPPSNSTQYHVEWNGLPNTDTVKGGINYTARPYVAPMGAGLSGSLSGTGMSAPFGANDYSTPIEFNVDLSAAQGTVSVTMSLDGGNTFAPIKSGASVFTFSRKLRVLPDQVLNGFGNIDPIYRIEWSISSGSVQYTALPLSPVRYDPAPLDTFVYFVRNRMLDYLQNLFDLPSLTPTNQENSAADQTIANHKKRNVTAAQAATSSRAAAARYTPLSPADIASLSTAYVLCRTIRNSVTVFALATLSIPANTPRVFGPGNFLQSVRAFRVASAQVASIIDDQGNAVSSAFGWNDYATGQHVAYLPSGTVATFTVGQTFAASSYDTTVRNNSQDLSHAHGIWCFPTALEALYAFGLFNTAIVTYPAPDVAAMGYVHQSDVPYPELTTLPA